MHARVGLLVVLLGLAGCVSGQSGMAPMSHTCITTVTGPDGKPQQAVIEADDAGAAALLCEGDMTTEAEIARAMLGDGPVSKANKVVTRTKPVQPTPAWPAATPAQVQPRAVQQDEPLIRHRTGGPGCGLKMVGGTGYVCALH